MMMKSSSYLFAVFVIGIFFLSVSTVGAGWDIRNKPSGTPVDKQSTEVDQKGGEVDFSWGVSDGELDRSKQPDTRIEPGDIFQPRQREPAIEPGDIFRPSGGDVLRQRDLPRVHQDLGEVIPPDFD